MGDNNKKWEWEQPISKEIFEMKYNIHNQESVEKIFEDISTEIASCETNDKFNLVKDEFYNQLISGKFIPAGRILANARPDSKMKNYNNCFTIKIDDSMEGIYDALKEDALIGKMGGGVGFNISNMRPRNSSISKGGESSGPLSFTQIFDASAKTIHTGGGRRGAHIAIMNVDHPDIEEFITIKQGDKNKALTQFNISVGITDAFIEQVKNDGDWDLKFKDKVYKTVKAKDLYDKITKNAFMNNEPGIFNLDHVNKENNGYYMYNIEQCNPCLTGDTLVAVADGRNFIPIKQLAEEGKDIPVYARDDNGEPIIKTMRNPRITGYDQDIYQVLLDDGSTIKCTGNHKFRMKDGMYKEAINLQSGESLAVYSKWNTLKEDEYSEKDGYWLMSNGKKLIGEHRFVYEQLTKSKIPEGYIIHHKDFNPSNNSVNNLQMMTKEEHDIIHDISGDKNPMIRYPEKNWRNDPQAQQKMREKYHIGAKRSQETKSKISQKAKERCSTLEYKVKASSNTKQAWINFKDIFVTGIEKRTNKHFKECQKLTDLECFVENNVVMVKKTCEHCGNEFSVRFGRREQAYCSQSCGAFEHNKKMAKISHDKANESHVTSQDMIFNLFSKYVNENNIIPSWAEFSYILNSYGINDLRTAGLSGSYKTFISNIFDNFNINPISVQSINKNTNNCKTTVAKQLIENGMIYNHKIVSVTKIGVDTVYNGTVDDVHNFDIIFNQTKTASGRDKLLSCNTLNCGEISMPEYAVCDLGAINFSKFVLNPFTDDAKIDWENLIKTIKVGVRFLDNVLTVTEYPLEKIKDRSMGERRIGLGFTGFADMLAMMKITYGEEDSLKLTHKLGEFLRNESYKASIELAKEKGQFPVLNREKFIESGFCKRLPNDIKKSILENGIRNININTCAPTGTISLSIGQNCSSGIEPMFSLSYKRSYRTGLGDETKQQIVYDNAWLKYLEHHYNKSYINLTEQEINLAHPDYFITTTTINVKKSIDIQAVWQKYIDSSISKTANLSPGTSLEEYQDLFMYAYDKGLKGFTTFNPSGNLKGILEYNEPKVKKEEYIERHMAPKRPDELPCDIHEISVDSKKWMVLVGKLQGSLYEIFVDENKDGLIDVNNHKEGIIKKNGKGKYSLIIRNGVEKVVKDNLAETMDATYGVMARMTSMALRHGTPLQFVVDQMSKSKHFMGFERAVSRVLKKYIKDGERVMTGDVCPECGGEMRYVEGCVSCTCGFSKCM